MATFPTFAAHLAARGSNDGVPPPFMTASFSADAPPSHPPLHLAGYGPLPGAPVDPLRADCRPVGTGGEGVSTVRTSRVNMSRAPEELWARSYSQCPTMASIDQTRALLGNSQVYPNGKSAPVCVNRAALDQQTDRINLSRGTGAFHLWGAGDLHPGHGVSFATSPVEVQRRAAWGGASARQAEQAAERALGEYADFQQAEAARFRPAR